MKKLIVVGGGFAGFWAAVSAVRQARALERSRDLRVTLISREENLGIRPRFYERKLEGMRVPLRNFCDELDIELIIAEVTGIDPRRRRISLAGPPEEVAFDSLILAAGSRLKSNGIMGAGKAFDVDTFAGATQLDLHLKSLSNSGFETEASRNIVVAGGGLTGLEVVTVMAERWKEQAGNGGEFQVFLIEKSAQLAAGYSKEGQAYILLQLEAAGIRLLPGEEVESIEPGGVRLKSGKTIAADTVINTAGMEATPLTAHFSGRKDELGRLYADQFLRLAEDNDVFVAGDAAKVLVDGENYALMSCQHALPQGKFAGHNAVCQLFGAEMAPYSQPRYVTCLDLGSAQALFTTSWERNVQMTGSDAKARKIRTNTQLIYPPRDIAETLDMSSPIVAKKE